MTIPSHSKHHSYLYRRVIFISSFLLDIKRRYKKPSVGIEICCLSAGVLFKCRFNGLAGLPITMLRMPEGLTFIPKSSVQLSSTSL